MLTLNCLPSYLNPIMTRVLIAGALTAVGIFTSVVPGLSWQFPRSLFSFSVHAYAQEFNAQQITNYARALLQIESHRRQAYQNIQNIIGKQPPNIICNRRSTIRNLPRNAQDIAINYCKISKKIVEESGLSVSVFNSITQKVRSDNNLRRRIQNAMIDIQRQQ